MYVMRNYRIGTATTDQEVNTSSHIIHLRITTGLQVSKRNSTTESIFKVKEKSLKIINSSELNIKTYCEERGEEKEKIQKLVILLNLMKKSEHWLLLQIKYI